MLLDLICPIDKEHLTEVGNSLQCTQGHDWKIANSIPRLVEDPDNYAANFGLQWQLFRKTQLDSHTGVPLSYERLLRCLGDDNMRELQGAASYTVLEAGCGAGRFTEILLRAPRARVFSVDYSSAVDANQHNFPQNNSHRIFQADIAKLPFAARQFDLVLCLGVIQHTPSPEDTIAKLYEQVKPGGALVIDHYRRSHRQLRVARIFRLFLKRLPPEAALRCTNRLVKALCPLHRAVSKSRILHMVLARLSPLITYYREYPELDDKQQYEWALLDTHDSLTDWHKHHRSRGEIKHILKNLGATDVHVSVVGNVIEARSRRPHLPPNTSDI